MGFKVVVITVLWVSLGYISKAAADCASSVDSAVNACSSAMGSAESGSSGYSNSESAEATSDQMNRNAISMDNSAAYTAKAYQNATGMCRGAAKACGEACNDEIAAAKAKLKVCKERDQDAGNGEAQESQSCTSTAQTELDKLEAKLAECDSKTSESITFGISQREYFLGVQREANATYNQTRTNSDEGTLFPGFKKEAAAETAEAATSAEATSSDFGDRTTASENAQTTSSAGQTQGTRNSYAALDPNEYNMDITLSYPDAKACGPWGCGQDESGYHPKYWTEEPAEPTYKQQAR